MTFFQGDVWVGFVSRDESLVDRYDLQRHVERYLSPGCKVFSENMSANMTTEQEQSPSFEALKLPQLAYLSKVVKDYVP